MRAPILGVAIVAASSFTVTMATAGEQFRLLRFDGHIVKWGDPELGTGARVSYAFVTKPTAFPNALNCGEVTSLDKLLETSGISWSTMRAEAAHAFAMWEGSTNIDFAEIDDPADAQILIGAQLKPRWNAFANVTHHVSPEASVGTIKNALICLNPEKRWKVGFDGNPAAFDLRYAIAHEIGHTIGLDHPGPAGELMSFKYLETFRELQAGDVAGAITLYGTRPTRLEMASDSLARTPVLDTIPEKASAVAPN